jgi:hypothetical protein
MVTRPDCLQLGKQAHLDATRMSRHYSPRTANPFQSQQTTLGRAFSDGSQLITAHDQIVVLPVYFDVDTVLIRSVDIIDDCANGSRSR